MVPTATCLWCEPWLTVTSSDLGADSFKASWSDEWGGGKLVATTGDGCRYEGHYRYNDDPDHGTVSLTRFHTAGGEQLFLGSWRSETDGRSGGWAFRIAAPSQSADDDGR